MEEDSGLTRSISSTPSLTVKAQNSSTATNVPLKGTDLNVIVIDDQATATLTQSFHNDRDEAINAVYLFPVLAQSCIIDLRAVVGDVVYRGIVDVRDKIEDREEQFKAKGITTVKANYFNSHDDVLKLDIGNIQANQSIKVTVVFSIKLDMITQQAYKLVIPMVLLSRETQESAKEKYQKNYDKLEIEAKDKGIQHTVACTYDFKFKITIYKQSTQDVVFNCFTSYLMTDFIEELDKEKVVFTLKEVGSPNTDIELMFKRTAKQEGSIPDATKAVLARAVPYKGDYEYKSDVSLPWCAAATFIIRSNSKPSFIDRAKQQDQRTSLYTDDRLFCSRSETCHNEKCAPQTHL